MAKYDIRRSLYQMRQAGYNVPTNVRELVTERIVRQIMRRSGVTEREAQRRAIAAVSTHEVGRANPLVKKTNVRGDLYYHAARGDKARMAEIAKITKAAAKLEANESAVGLAEMRAESFRKKGNKGLTKVWENRVEKLRKEQERLRDAALGYGLLSSRKIGAPNVDAAGIASLYNTAQRDVENSIRDKSLKTIRQRIERSIETFRANVITGMSKYSVPGFIRQAMISRVRKMSLIQVDELSKKGQLEILRFMNYDAFLDYLALLGVMRKIGFQPDDLGLSRDDALMTIRNWINSESSNPMTIQDIADELGW